MHTRTLPLESSVNIITGEATRSGVPGSTWWVVLPFIISHLPFVLVFALAITWVMVLTSLAPIVVVVITGVVLIPILAVLIWILRTELETQIDARKGYYIETHLWERGPEDWERKLWTNLRGKLGLSDKAQITFEYEGTVPELRHEFDRTISLQRRWYCETNATGIIKLYIAEEQQVLREAYIALLQDRPGFEVTGASGDTSADSLVVAALASGPQVMLLGFKTLDATTVDKLRTIREKCPNVAMVVLSANYEVKGIKALTEFARATPAGCAYLLKHTIDTVEQLTQAIYSAADGRIILNPAVMDGMIASQDPYAAPMMIRDGDERYLVELKMRPLLPSDIENVAQVVHSLKEEQCPVSPQTLICTPHQPSALVRAKSEQYRINIVVYG